MKRAFLIMAAGLGVAGSLRADSTETFGPTSTPLTNGVATTLGLPQFDPNLGTLLGVTVEYGVSFSGISVILTNVDATAQTGDASFSATGLSISSVAYLGNIPSDLQNLLIRAFDIYDDSGEQTLAANGGGYTWSPRTEDAHDSATLNSSSGFGGYQGSGSFSATILENFSEDVAIGGSGNEGEINTPTSTFYGSVSYDYMPVPEPVNLAGFGLIIVGSRWLWRQRRRLAL